MTYLYQHADFSDFINQVVDIESVPAAIVEKDYWVTYVLYRLQKSEFNGKFLFKGGTSLSKGWGLIKRFSEDIDLLFLPDDLGSKAKKRRLEQVRDLVDGFAGLTLDGANEEARAGNGSRTSCYKYERKREHQFGSLRPFLKLEMGFRGGPEPQTVKTIQSLIGKALESKDQADLAEDVRGFEITLLDPKRTFVEKLFAIHAAAAKNASKGQSRHYYDLYMLLGLPEIQAFIGTAPYKELRADVHKYSTEEFPDSSVPDLDRMSENLGIKLADDLKRSLQVELESSEMIFGDRPSISQVLAELGKYSARL